MKLPGQTGIAWAVFDPAWYLAAYPDVGAEIGDADDAAVLRFYLEHGQRRGHSPNIWFDEVWHLKVHPGAAASVRESHAESAFDTYCHAGFRFRSPHWLFQEVAYRRRYPDLRDEVLEADGSANGYDHYLKHGSREGRIGHLLFDPAVYRARLDAGEQAAIDAEGSMPTICGVSGKAGQRLPLRTISIRIGTCGVTRRSPRRLRPTSISARCITI